MYYVYVIECKTPDHYYIGLTRFFDRRIRRHMNGKAARFTRLHGFNQVVHMEHHRYEEDAKARESELTEYYIRRYGIENVAGGGWSQVRKGKIQGAKLQRRRWKQRY